jgi:hypothetical protein
MKKIYALLMLALPMLGFAQTNDHVVTFKVNTANITVGPNGLFLGGGIFGGSNAIQLTDADGNGVYEVTDTVNGSNGGNFIFFNSPTSATDWATKENLAGLPCGDAANFNDRIMPTFTKDTTLLFCFNACVNDTVCPAPQADYLLTFKVNTSNITVGPNGIYAGGGILGGSRALELTDDDGDGVYEADTLITGQGGGNYIFLNSPANDADWGTKEDLTGLPCADAGNYNDRIMPSFGQDTTLSFCFGTCDTACSSIGILEADANFVVKPNPASDVLFIENTTGTASTVAIYSVTGAKVMEQNFEANTRLDVAALPRGMYIVRVQNGMTERVVRIALK